MEEDRSEYSFDIEFLKRWFWQSQFLTIVFVGLKAGRIIDWPWLWVVCPLWIMAAATILFIVIAGILLAVEVDIDRRRRKHSDN